MCGFPDKKTRFVLTKNPSHKSRYYNFFLAGIPKRINRLPGCCLVSRIQTKITPIIRDMVLVTPGMASMISDWSTMEKASSSCSKRSIRSSVSAFSARSRLPVHTLVLERFPFFASAYYVFAAVFCAGFVCATLKYPTVPSPATQTAATGMITISLLRRRFIFLNLQICYVCSLCFKNVLKEKCVKSLCDLWKPGEKGRVFFVRKYS